MVILDKSIKWKIVQFLILNIEAEMILNSYSLSTYALSQDYAEN